MQEKTCKDCKYFVQHYALGEDRFFRVFAGHCMFARPKNKQSYTKSCENFEPGVMDDARFVSKKYLSKALLNYILSMELLSEIQEQVLPLTEERKTKP